MVPLHVTWSRSVTLQLGDRRTPHSLLPRTCCMALPLKGSRTCGDRTDWLSVGVVVAVCGDGGGKGRGEGAGSVYLFPSSLRGKLCRSREPCPDAGQM